MYLNGFSKKMTSNLAQNHSNRSGCYGSNDFEQPSLSFFPKIPFTGEISGLAMQRRAFLLGAAALAAAAALPACGRARPVRYLTASSDAQGRYYLNGLDAAGKLCFSLPSRWRGHSMAVNPAYPHRLVFIARRPGTQLALLDASTATRLRQVQAGRGRHFVGHACFSAAGRYLFTPENDYQNGRGVVSVRDADSLAVLDEMPSYGIGPHELHLLGDGKTLVVANGGIRTHPDRPREKLNLDNMQSSLCYVDIESGRQRDEFRLADAQQSIRHLDVSADGTVACAVQYEGLPHHARPLVYTHRGEEQLQAVQGLDWLKLKQYTGSVTFAGQGTVFAVSSPRANRLTLWDAQRGQLLAMHNLRDVCGIAWDARGQYFVVTTGVGMIYRLSADGQSFKP